MNEIPKKASEFDKQKIRTYLHLEGIPGFVLSNYEKQYLRAYREALLAEQGSSTISEDTIISAFHGMTPVSDSEKIAEQADHRKKALEKSVQGQSTATIVSEAENKMQNESNEYKKSKQSSKKSTKSKSTTKKTTKKQTKTTKKKTN